MKCENGEKIARNSISFYLVSPAQNALSPPTRYTVALGTA